MRVVPKLSNTTSGTRTQTPFKELELKSSVSANFTKVANLLTILKNNVVLNFVRGREPQKGSQGGHALPMVNQAIHST